MNTCRVCGNAFFEGSLLQFRNMPGAAQMLPDDGSLKADKGVDLEVIHCSGCGLVQLRNDPVPYYKEVIRAGGFSEEMKDFRRKQFGRFIHTYSLEKKKIIEVGCGSGEYLSLLQEGGAPVYGLEHSEESVARCVKRGLRVSRGFVESAEYRIPNAPFDAFFMLSFLEHLPEPNGVLRGIYNNLADEAVGLVEVPNFELVRRKNLFSEFIGDHLLYFTRATLSTVLAINGFELLECHEIWYDYILSAEVKKRKKLNISCFTEHREKIQKELMQYLRRFPRRKVAIWGAGHQALAVISLTELSDKIRFVVDSASFKQGKYTPASHLPIVSPDALATDPVEAVIVMAAGYSDEVARMLRRKFDAKMDISILRDYGLESL